MKIPNKIKVLGFDWIVDENQNVANEGGVFGSTHHRKQIIFIDPSETQQKKEHTLIHEILHTIWWQTGLTERFKKIENLEEEVVQTLAHGLYHVLKDNNLLNEHKDN